jgi:hypothetical protein
MTHSRRVALLLAAALLAPACGNNNVTLPDVSRAVLAVTVNPSPVPGTQNEVTGSVAAAYSVVITETGGLGGDMVFVSSQVFDPETGLMAAINYFDAADLIVFVGGKHVEPLGTLTVPQTTSYVLPDFRKPALLSVSVQMKDDRGNLINQSVLVKIE